jgi:hypothetical protein
MSQIEKSTMFLSFWNVKERKENNAKTTKIKHELWSPKPLHIGRSVVVMGRDFVSALQPWWLLVLSPDRSKCDRVSKRDQLGLTPNLTTRDLWRSKRWARENENFVYSSL